MNSNGKRRPGGVRHAISLAELIVVLGIIAVMLGMFFPAVQRVRAAARTTVCKSNLRQINLALSQHAELVGLPPSNDRGIVGGWQILVLQYLEQGNLQRNISEDSSIDDLDRQFFELPAILQCPTQASVRPSNDGIGSSHYRLSAWPSDEKRDAYGIVEVPLGLELPWVSSPEIAPAFDNGFVDIDEAPHSGGYHYAGGFQYDVKFCTVE